MFTMRRNREFPFLFLWSSFLLIIAAIVLRFLHILLTASFLRLYSINFTYAPLNIHFSTVGYGNWSSESILIVYVFANLFFMFLGVFLLRVLKVSKFRNLKIRLFVTWLAFLSIHLLPVNVLAGVGFYAEFGMAFSWFIGNIAIRFIAALAVLVICLYFRPFWIILFLKTSPSFSAIDAFESKKAFIKVSLIYPMLSASIIVFFLAISISSFFWIIAFFGYTLLLLPAFGNAIPYMAPRLVKTNDTFVFSRSTGLIMAGAVLVIVAFLLFIS